MAFVPPAEVCLAVGLAFYAEKVGMEVRSVRQPPTTMGYSSSAMRRAALAAPSTSTSR